ncbi:MAG: hypothetical protein K2H60_06085 [Muribaculaceae bacterium]|nr:hypothetical protein [Muribaculaceae bacterium]
MTRTIITRCGFSLITFLGIWLFLWLQCPQYLLYHEQNQLFLFTGTYFTNSIVVPGGMADYLSEFVVQFYYVPLYGALLTAFILTLSQVFLGLACRGCALSEETYALAALPSILYVAAMADENILLSYAMAMMMTTLSLLLFSLHKNGTLLTDTFILAIGFAILYWLAGPFALTFIIAGGILCRRSLTIAIALPIAFLIIWGIHSLWFEQYPLSRLLQGINYYRVPEIYPTLLYVIALVTVLIPLLTKVKKETMHVKIGATNLIAYTTEVAVLLFAVVYIPTSFDKNKSRILTYNSLVRQGRWADIIEKAQKEKPTDFFSLQAINLALGMTGNLTESMFQYNQKGTEGLIGRDRLDNTTQLITAEALYRLGLTNIAFSTTFDLQEAIMNDRKSGRLMKRMAECMLINGNYKVAAKYLGILRHSLYYADWARHAEKLLGDDNAVEAHPVYGPLRRNAFKKEAFYDSTQIDKILAMLTLDSDGSNKLAWQYFCAAAMLKGDLATLAGVCNYFSEHYTHPHLPRHVQEAIAMYWTSTNQSFEGVPFPISPEVQQQTAALAQAVMSNKNNPAAWKAVAPDSYGIYFLSNALTQPADSSPEYQPTHE